uniref:Phosphofurin acidic cluster sorting protein 1-like n=1 Tax=Ciona intestinalis TaxID=7719 RepID=F6X413_CIOIN
MARTSSQASVPMNLFATWDIDRSSANCIPRICNMTICKLKVTKELDKDMQSVFIAVKMQYPHFVKRDENRLQLMLQRKKRYKNRAMLGYKTLAVGRVDMAQIIQYPICHNSNLDLFAAGKDQNVTVAAHITLSCMTSVPIDADIETERNGKHGGADRSPDVDNYSEDEEEMYSSDPDLGSDNPQDIYFINEQEFADDEARAQKQKNRQKLRMSSSSRQQNFIKTKVAALIRRFKQVADEGLEPDLGPDPDSNPADPVDYDFLYDEIEDFNLSDSCPEIEDNISIVSTPKPKLRPFFDRISHSSSQTEISSLRDQVLSVKPSKTIHVPSHTGHTSHPSSAPSSPKSDHMKHPSQDHMKPSHDKPWRRSSSLKVKPDKMELPVSYYIGWYILAQPSVVVSHTLKQSPTKLRFCSTILTVLLYTRIVQLYEHQIRILNNSCYNNYFQIIPFDPDTFLGTDDDKLPDSLMLIDGNDRHGRTIATMMSSSGIAQPTVTRNLADLQTVFTKLVLKLQKFVNSNSASPSPIKVGVIGRELYLAYVLRYFVEQLSGKSPDWQSFLVFYVVPLGSHRLARHMGSLDARYGSLFTDPLWRENVDKLDGTNTTESGCDAIVTRIMEYMDEASNVLPLTIAEAMLTFRQTGKEEGSSQKFIPFISEIRVGENDLMSSCDSDKEEGGVVTAATAPSTSQAPVNVTSPPASPSVPAPSIAISSTTTTSSSGPLEVKLGLQVDYWKEKDNNKNSLKKEKDNNKNSLKTNFRSFHVSCLPLAGDRAVQSGLILDVVTKGKKMIMRLPGKKGKEKEAESKSQAVGSINRLICTSKHQNSLLRVQVDGVEWRDIKFFQLSSHWSSHVNAFPVASF